MENLGEEGSRMAKMGKMEYKKQWITKEMEKQSKKMEQMTEC
jgi:hypothetical protein